MINFKEYSDNRMKELVRSFEKEPNSKIFVDTLIHSKYNYPDKHNEVLAFVKNNFGISLAGEWEWRCNRVIADIDIQQSVMGFISGQHLKD